MSPNYIAADGLCQNSKYIILRKQFLNGLLCDTEREK